MNHLLDADQHEDTQPADREISLGPATILGIFFALALMCAVFFGFGYSLGRKSAQTAAAGPTASAQTSNALTTAAKPTAGSPATAPSKSSTPTPDQVAATPAPPPAASTVAVPIASSAPGAKTVPPSDTIIAGDKLPAPQPATGNPQPATSFVVQVAAVSTQDIADIELSALKKYGYDVHVRREPQDQLLHVQIGPFATRKDAEAMRQNVLSHGFNAIVK